MREEADAVAARCGADLRVSALAADTPAAQRDALLHAGQLVVATPGQVAQARRAPGRSCTVWRMEVLRQTAV